MSISYACNLMDQPPPSQEGADLVCMLQQFCLASIKAAAASLSLGRFDCNGTLVNLAFCSIRNKLVSF